MFDIPRKAQVYQRIYVAAAKAGQRDGLTTFDNITKSMTDPHDFAAAYLALCSFSPDMWPIPTHTHIWDRAKKLIAALLRTPPPRTFTTGTRFTLEKTTALNSRGFDGQRVRDDNQHRLTMTADRAPAGGSTYLAAGPTEQERKERTALRAKLGMEPNLPRLQTQRKRNHVFDGWYLWGHERVLSGHLAR